MGFPTANIEADAALDARDGVYASRVEVDGRMYDAMSNLGYKPTVDGRRRLLETNIFGFEGDLYGRRLRVELLRFIRPERRFGSVEELYAEIEKAVAAGLMASNPLKDRGFVPGDYSQDNYDKIDLHRPFVDEVVLISPTGKPMKRETDLIDVWFDSGAMPYAQIHYPIVWLIRL